MKTALALFASIVASAAAFAADSSPDRDFALQAARAGAGEVALGRLAVAQARSQATKTFGQRMIDDHTRAGEELKAAARADGVDLPAEASPSPADARLANLHGAEFDDAYVDVMVEDHEKAVELFRREARAGGQPNLKAFAGKTLPTLEEHLRMARALQAAGPEAKTRPAPKHDAGHGGSR